MSALAVALALFAVAGPRRRRSRRGRKTPASSTARKAPKPPPPPATSLEVAVTDPAGGPVEGAFVWPCRAGGLPLLRRARAGKGPLDGHRPEGKARLESLPPGPWNVTVYARGFVTQPVRRGPPARRGAAREGRGHHRRRTRRTASGRSRAPESEWAAGSRLPGDWQEDATRNEMMTDAAGRFRLEGIGRTAETVIGPRAGLRSRRAPRSPLRRERRALPLPGSDARGRRPGRGRTAREGRRGAGRGRGALEREPARRAHGRAGALPDGRRRTRRLRGRRPRGRKGSRHRHGRGRTRDRGQRAASAVGGWLRDRADRGRGRATARWARSGRGLRGPRPSVVRE